MLDVVVPSHARAKLANVKTLRLLADRGITTARVHVIVDPAEIAAYEAELDPALYGALIPGASDVCGQRNAAFGHFPEGAQVVSLDDDLSDIRQRVNEKETLPVADLDELFARGFAACDVSGATLWGVYPVLNPMFMKAGITTGLAFCIGQLFGFVNTREPWCRFDLAPKGDYAHTLARYEHDGAVVRLNDIAAKSRMYAQGGIAARMNDDQRRAANRHAVAELRRRWPQWVTITARRSQGGLEVRLRDRAPAAR